MNISLVGLIILLIILIFTVWGWKSGFIKTVFDVFSLVLVMGLTGAFYPHLAKILMNTRLKDTIYDYFVTTFTSSVNISEETFVNLPSFIHDTVVLSTENIIGHTATSMAEIFTVFVVNVISIILLFISLFICSFFIKKLAKFINKIIIVGHINKILGAILGFFQGVLISYLIICVISFFPASKIYTYVAEDMEKSYISKFMFNEKINLFGIQPIYPERLGE
ncbi:MAG: CvpA family protein [Ruminococcaceae bacterium]|nr:CvpA family protein [Oscillospiraceae bacterium]